MLAAKQGQRGAGSPAQDALLLSLRLQPKSGTKPVLKFWAGVVVQPLSTSGSSPAS